MPRISAVPSNPYFSGQGLIVNITKLYTAVEQELSYDKTPISIIGGVKPYVVTYSGGTLPSGLSVTDNTTGRISGTTTSSTTLGLYTYTLTVTDATGMYVNKTLYIYVRGAVGYQIFNASATEQTWTCPARVRSISVVCVGAGGSNGPLGGGGGGGGALTYGNNITVVPGNTYAVKAGVGVGGTANGGDAGQSSYFVNSSFLVAGGGGGGSKSPNNNYIPGGGGGGGGYSGNGGRGGEPSPSITYSGGIGGTSGGSARSGGGSGGIGGAGVGSTSTPSYTNGAAGSGGGGGGGFSNYSGGGVGIYGEGTSGSSASNNTAGQGGSGGTNGTMQGPPSNNTQYSLYGGGAAGIGLSASRAGASGVVRIIWPGDLRTFPNDNVGSSTDNSGTVMAVKVTDNIITYSGTQVNFLPIVGLSTQTDDTTGITYSITSGTLPSGITINAGTGYITGTSTQTTVNFNSYTVTVTDGTTTASARFNYANKIS
jgi:hypothetical protein